MSRPYALLRAGFPYVKSLGMRRVTNDPIDIALGPLRRTTPIPPSPRGVEMATIVSISIKDDLLHFGWNFKVKPHTRRLRNRTESDP